jgi:hypothetical protein
VCWIATGIFMMIFPGEREDLYSSSWGARVTRAHTAPNEHDCVTGASCVLCTASLHAAL